MNNLFGTFSISLLIASSAHASSNGGRGGGMTIEDKPVSVAQIQNALADSAFFIRAWLHKMEDKFETERKQSATSSVKSALPIGIGRLFDSKYGGVYFDLENLTVIFKTKSACSSSGSNDRDGSVVEDHRRTVCISGYNLSQKLDSNNFAIQVDALLIHEVSHLFGADEAEATAIQRRYLADMASVPKELIMRELERRSEGFGYISSPALTELVSTIGNKNDFCPALEKVMSAWSQTTNDVPLSTISLNRPESDQEFRKISSKFSNWKRMLCAKESKKQTTAELDSLRKSLESLKMQIRDYAWNLQVRFLIRPEVKIDDLAGAS